MSEENYLDSNGQPLNMSFNRGHNIEKAFTNLLGIVAGIQGDKALTTGEVVFFTKLVKCSGIFV